eukprot:gb/GECH01010628.1/.p1 GENE.gb/GECH01010628.1/~~gb/GECH01010628.1/.p1  ORF type:complete len:372 (+),score=126.11 gb/GECH01010628.1/:1-1116(+)
MSSTTTIYDEQSLSERFSQAVKQYTSIMDSNSDSQKEEFQKFVKNVIKEFFSLNVAISQLHLFSSNEDLEDITTKSLKYMLTPYYIGDLILKIVDNNRLHHLKQSKAQFHSFLNTCEQYEVVDKTDLNILSREGPVTPEIKRAERIERYKREKYLSSCLADFAEQKEKLIGGHEEEDVDSRFEEIERNHSIYNIKLHCRRAVDQLNTINQEIELLEYAQNRSSEELQSQNTTSRQPSSSSSSSSSSWRIDRHQMPPGMDVVDVAPGMQRIVNTSSASNATDSNQQAFDRQQMREQVFMHRNPPTQSLDSYAQEEMQRLQEAQQREAEQAAAEQEIDPDDEEETDRQTYRSRDWDNWKDANPRGAGNMLRRH